MPPMLRAGGREDIGVPPDPPRIRESRVLVGESRVRRGEPPVPAGESHVRRPESRIPPGRVPRPAA
ncbi:hypothetical protein GCM10009559_02790 [Pseudonocardia zijingensis]|uniref:Uncharacterized protein n=1 Tax=Pseudonocardia zijingensis TaxID=153376 RepID=A0ABN1NZS3_9PSEU